MEQQSFLTVSEAARLLEVSEGTIRRWFDQQRLPGVRVGFGRLVYQDAVSKIIAEKSQPESAT